MCVCVLNAKIVKMAANVTGKYHQAPTHKHTCSCHHSHTIHKRVRIAERFECEIIKQNRLTHASRGRRHTRNRLHSYRAPSPLGQYKRNWRAFSHYMCENYENHKNTRRKAQMAFAFIKSRARAFHWHERTITDSFFFVKLLSQSVYSSRGAFSSTLNKQVNCGPSLLHLRRVWVVLRLWSHSFSRFRLKWRIRVNMRLDAANWSKWAFGRFRTAI